MHIVYDSRHGEHKRPFGCLIPQQDCYMMIAVDQTVQARQIELVIEDDQGRVLQEILLPNHTAHDGIDQFDGTISLEDCGLYYYYFKVVCEQEWFYFFKHQVQSQNRQTEGKWQLLCYDEQFETPDEFSGKVMYQIFPDRFYHQQLCDTTHKLKPFYIHQDMSDLPVFLPDEHGIVQNNDFFGGNLQGIIQKLGYLDTLGVSVLYLNPIFKAYSSHRYDTCDYKEVDPLLGTLEDFQQLCHAAQGYGMKVILDIAFSHTGDRSIYFDKYDEFGKGAYHHSDSPYRDWYQRNPKNPAQYTSWWGIDTLPCTNEQSPSFLEEMILSDHSVVKHWMDLGADGFRLDVADELPGEFLTLFRQRVKQINPHAIIIGEVWEDGSNKISYGERRQYFWGKQLDATMNYPFKEGIIALVKRQCSTAEFVETVMTIVENYPQPVLHCVMNSLSTHDTQRILTILGVEEIPADKEVRGRTRLTPEQKIWAVKKMEMAVFLQFVLPGTACIYYGDEIGMEGFEDPFNRQYFDWKNMNLSLLTLHQELGYLKNKLRALQVGDLVVVDCTQEWIHFSRTYQQQKLDIFLCLQSEYQYFVGKNRILWHNGIQQQDQLVLGAYQVALVQQEG